MQRRIGRRLVLVISLHHGIAAQYNFTLCFPVTRYQFAGVGIHHGSPLMHREGHTLPALQIGLFIKAEIVPVLTPYALRDMSIGFGQPVYLHHIEIHLGHFLQDGGGWRRAGGEDAHLVIQLRAHLLRCVDQQRQHNRGTAKMRDPVRADRAENGFGTDLANQHSGRRHHRHGPDMAPAIAMEHRHDIEICGMLRQRPAGGRTHTHQIGTAMVVDDSLRTARCA